MPIVEISNLDVSTIKDIICKLFRDIEYRPESFITDDNVTYQALRSEFAAYDNGDAFDSLCRLSANLAELPYPMHSDEVRYQIAKCTWFLFYIDDLGHSLPEYLLSFQKRILTDGKGPMDSFYQAHREFLTSYYRLYEPLSANCIIMSSLDFINGSIMEETSEIRDMKLTQASQTWPDFLRRKAGHAHAYAYFLFPMEANVDLTTYIQVIDDMADVVNLVNDVLSFYKEHLAGERNNYVYNRAYVTKKTVTETLQELANETLRAHQKVSNALALTSEKALAYWKQFVNGYMGYHCTHKRYRLHELDILPQIKDQLTKM